MTPRSTPTKASPTDVRMLLKPDVRLAPAKYVNRPAPAHVINNFVVSALGETAGKNLVVRYAASEKRAEHLAQHPSISGTEWDPSLLGALGADLKVIMDPDRRVFNSQGSPLPIDARLASASIADDGLGAELWESVPVGSRYKVALALAKLLDSSQETDPASAAARFLLRDVPADSDASAPAEPRDGIDTGTDSTREESAFSRALAQMLEHAIPAAGGGGRLEAIRDLSTLLFFSTVLGLLVEARTASADHGAIGDSLGILVFTGLPPGDGADELVRDAQLSFRFAARRAHTGLVAVLTRALEDAWDATAPADVRLETALRLRTAGTSGQDQLIERLQVSAPFTSEGGTPLEPAEWAEAIFREAYPAEHLAKAIRSMGVKVGFVGPKQGFGKPRFILETPLLATLAKVLVAPQSSISFEEFIVRARDRLGIVLGSSGIRELPEATAAAFQSERLALQQLRKLEGLLRNRMVEAGLARRFSDLHTMVIVQ